MCDLSGGSLSTMQPKYVDCCVRCCLVHIVDTCMSNIGAHLISSILMIGDLLIPLILLSGGGGLVDTISSHQYWWLKFFNTTHPVCRGGISFIKHKTINIDDQRKYLLISSILMVGVKKYCPCQQPHYFVVKKYHQIVDAMVVCLGKVMYASPIITIDDRRNLYLMLTPWPVWQG